MAMALMLQELNAASFDSGNADSGDVLTADGSGGTSWEAPSGGGGGGSGVFDGAVFTVDTDNGNPYGLTIDLTLNGSPVVKDTIERVYFLFSISPMGQNAISIIPTNTTNFEFLDTKLFAPLFLNGRATCDLGISDGDRPVTVYLGIKTPSGSWIFSDLIAWPEL